MAGAKVTADIIAGSVSERTFKMYKRDFGVYAKFAGDDLLDSAAFSRWREHMATQTTYSPKTINRMLTSVRSVMREAAARKMITKELYSEFLFIRSVKERSMKSRLKLNNRTRIVPDDMRRLCNAPDKISLLGIRDRALLLTLASSGARITEVITLTRDHVGCDSGSCYIMVNGKIDTVWRRAPLSKEAYEVMSRWLVLRGVDSEYVFTAFAGRGSTRATTRRMTSVSGWRVVKKYADQIGLEHIKPHDFRRFVATQLVKKNPRQAQLALGHTSIASTYQYYVLDELENGVTDDLF